MEMYDRILKALNEFYSKKYSLVANYIFISEDLADKLALNIYNSNLISLLGYSITSLEDIKRDILSGGTKMYGVYVIVVHGRKDFLEIV